MNNQNAVSAKHLLKTIDEASFMIDEITLYLDTHPNCKDAIVEFKKYEYIRKKAIHEYTVMYGPLTRYDVNAENYWCWINNPWPWEKECGC